MSYLPAWQVKLIQQLLEAWARGDDNIFLMLPRQYGTRQFTTVIQSYEMEGHGDPFDQYQAGGEDAGDRDSSRPEDEARSGAQGGEGGSLEADDSRGAGPVGADALHVWLTRQWARTGPFPWLRTVVAEGDRAETERRIDRAFGYDRDGD